MLVSVCSPACEIWARPFKEQGCSHIACAQDFYAEQFELTFIWLEAVTWGKTVRCILAMALSPAFHMAKCIARPSDEP